MLATKSLVMLMQAGNVENWYYNSMTKLHGTFERSGVKLSSGQVLFALSHPPISLLGASALFIFNLAGSFGTYKKAYEESIYDTEMDNNARTSGL